MYVGSRYRWIDIYLCSPIVLRYACAPTSTRSELTTVGVIFYFYFSIFWFLWICRFSAYCVPSPFPFCEESMLYVFLPDGVSTLGSRLDFDIYRRKNLINHSIEGREGCGLRHDDELFIRLHEHLEGEQ